MKRILLSAVGLAIVASLSACSPYYWEDQYAGSNVNLDGPLRRNIEYVSGGTIFDAPEEGARVQTVAAPAARTLSVQAAPVQTTQIQVPAAQVQTQVVQQAGATVQTQTFQVPANAAAFAAPAGTTATVTTTQAPVTFQAGSGVTQAVTQGLAAQGGNAQATVPLAYATAGQSQDLQTRRVGDVGLIVFSNLIGDDAARGAAQRSCAQIGKTAATSTPTDIQMGVRQLNFSCS